MDTLFRVFVLKELHGWEHETALYEYLESHPVLCERLGLETVPDQSTLWRSWHTRFTNALRNTVQKSARTILIKAQNADVTVPREPEQILPARGDDVDEAVPDDRAILSTSQSLLVETSAC
ncbi:transposase [Haloferax volcanii]|nr:transposase [Haloferax volcanii]MDW7539298.1 transposase [Haloferax volcanii]